MADFLIGHFFALHPQHTPNSLNLESSAGQDKVCCCGGAWVGVTAQNGRSISSSYNNAMRHHSSASYSVARFTLWARQEKTLFLILISTLVIAQSGQLRNLGSYIAKQIDGVKTLAIGIYFLAYPHNHLSHTNDFKKNPCY